MPGHLGKDVSSDKDPRPTDNQQLLSRHSAVNTYVVKWSQRVCIESASGEIGTRQAVVHNSMMFTLSGLKFNCHYALQLRGLTNTGEVAFTWNTCFCTGSCKETQIKGNRFPQCPRDEAASAPQPPARLRWSLISLLDPNTAATADDPAGPPLGDRAATAAAAAAAAVAARISWAAPDHTAMHAIKGFRLTWGPAEDEGGVAAGYRHYLQQQQQRQQQQPPMLGLLEPRMDPARSDASVVDMREREFLIYRLRPATLYVVAVQTMTVFGDSRSARLLFATPPAHDGDGAAGSGSSSVQNSEVQKYINNKDNNGYYGNGAGRPQPGLLLLLATSATVLVLLVAKAADVPSS